MKSALCLILLLIAGSVRADPAAVANQTRAWRILHEKEILAEFAELLAIPNLATDTPNIQRNAEAIRALCEKRGLTAKLVKLEGAPPVVVAELAAPNAKRTVAFYAHYDGQPVDPAQWKSEPWKPVMRDKADKDIDWQNVDSIDPEWRLFARSSGDDKAAIVAMLAALDALREQAIRPSVNLRFFFEGEEEAGSPHLAAYLKKFPDVARPDAWIFCDGPVHQSRRMELVFGARGTIGLDLTVYGPIKGLHDGHYGNWVPNPIVRLTHLIDSGRERPDPDPGILRRCPRADGRGKRGARENPRCGSGSSPRISNRRYGRKRKTAERITFGACPEPSGHSGWPRRRRGIQHHPDRSARLD
jgi:acetylornithine deacetylase/succinyl-diaminopimelate desuccinylase-like protein